MYGLNLIYYQNILSSKQTIMETHLDHEMRQCADQMMELQQKAIELQEQKIEHIQTETSKIRDIEPSMKVMKDWLNYNTEQTEYYKIAESCSECNCWFSGGDHRSTCKGEICMSKAYEKACSQKAFTTYGQGSHPSHPSQFMKEFIEATYNLFQIQQQKIEDLETQVNSQ